MVLEFGSMRDHGFVSCPCYSHVCFLFGISLSQLDVNPNSNYLPTCKYGVTCQEAS